MARPSGVVTLLTDFGTRDGYVGAMKGRILRSNRALAIVDLTHDVPPGDVLFGAFALAQAVPFFPKGSVHCAVVDPGVGGQRAAVAVEFAGQWMVGPDNGIFSLAARGPRRVFRIEVERLYEGGQEGGGVCATFHGRDIFAPAAARLASGVEPGALGPEVYELVTLEIREPERIADGYTAEVIHVDRFGNLVTNLPEQSLAGPNTDRWRVTVGSAEVSGVRKTFSDVESGSLVAYVGSAGYLEVGVRNGSAAERLNVDRGEKVALRHPDSQKPG